MNKFNEHVMIDLETLGTKPGCVILTIGACTLDLSENFYDKISVESSSEGFLMKKDLGTLEWWSNQDPAAMQEAFSGTKTLDSVLIEFGIWLNKIGKGVKVWGNGADFDLSILGAAYEACVRPIPWKPYSGRCYRTIKNLHKDVIPDAFRGIKHTALADAQFQALHLAKIARNKGLILS
jgi:DNA polymerase III epsilon subunit-like protein